MVMPLPLKQLPEVAEQILRYEAPDATRSLEIEPLREHYAKRFMDRKNLKKVKQKPIELARKEAHNPVVIRQWFTQLKSVVGEYRVKPANLWNFDGTGFRIGVGGSERVVTTDPKRRAWSPRDTNRKHLTAVEAVSAAGAVIEPMLIASGRVLQERWFEELTDNTLVGVNDSGYIDDELAPESIQHFERFIRP